jgi:hypothetical protein
MSMQRIPDRLDVEFSYSESFESGFKHKEMSSPLVYPPAAILPAAW